MYVRYRFIVALVLVLMWCIAISGCAALPIPFQPANEQYNSNMAEGAWLVLDAVDTAQTMHLTPGTACAYEADPIAKALYGGANPKPARVLLTNIGLAIGHTMITSWLDDKVAAEDIQREKDDEYGIGPWLATRFVWHAVSLVVSGSSVANNLNHGCRL